MDSFKQGGKYLTKMSDGSIVTLTSVFSIESNSKTYHTLKGKYAGDEHLGTCPIPAERILREASWEEYFDRWLDGRTRVLFKPIDKQLKQLEQCLN